MSLALEQESAMGIVMTDQMTTAQRPFIGHLSVAQADHPVAPEAALASGLDADHIATLYAHAIGLHNIRPLMSIVLDPTSFDYPCWWVKTYSRFSGTLSPTMSSTISAPHRLHHDA